MYQFIRKKIVIDDGKMLTCGTGDSGQLGTGSREAELIPKDISSTFKEKIADISAGICNTCAVTDSGIVWAMGGNSTGQLGIGNKKASSIPVKIKELEKTKIKKITCGHHTAALSEDGELYVWGTSVFGELLTPAKLDIPNVKLQDVHVGGNFGAALDQNGKIWTWGLNTAGELGVGDYDARISPIKSPQLDSKTVVAFSCGGSHAIALGITHSFGEPSNRSKRMDSVITHELKQSSRYSADIFNANVNAPNNDKKLENNIEPEESSTKQMRNSRHQLSSSNNHQDHPHEVPSVSDLNTAEIISSVSQRDPHQPVINSLIIILIIILY